MSSPAIHTPPNAVVEPESTAKNFLRVLTQPGQPDVDIVAVHGLDPLGRKLHAEATWTAGNALWLQDFLPQRLPNARILLFDYNANVAFQTSTAGVLEQAESLLNQLEIARAAQTDRPLIFICHSLGGILVKRTLISAKHSDTYQNIVNNTYGIIFFGTPHRGGNNAKIGDAFAGVVRRLGRKPKNSFMSALKSDSWFANSITNDFRQFLEEFHFLSFYETRPLGMFGLVVDPKAAVLGLPGSREKQIPLDADHSGICKFESSTDPIYQQVEENIARMAKDAVQDSIDRQQRSEVGSEGNSQNSQGDGNDTIQIGRSNDCRTTGNDNKSHQFGQGSKSTTSGNENTTMQWVADPAEVEKYMQRYFETKGLRATENLA
ncbi:Serine active site containing protein 1 [Pestalotiopsis sp. 9143b]|nr:Serine active site containing protein 1 [Pestalotiopsis sp. 9143b]